MPIEKPREPPTTDADWDRWSRTARLTLENDSVTPSMIQAHAVTNSKLAAGPARSILGNPTASAADRTDIVASGDGQFLVQRSGVLTMGGLVDADIPATIARDTEVTAAVAAANLASGAYSPTLTNVANLDGSTAFAALYLRVGDVVTVSGKVSVNPTAAGSVQLGISLPFASNITDEQDCNGAAFSPTIAGQGAAILGDTANNRAQMQWIAVDTTNQPMFFTFTYRII